MIQGGAKGKAHYFEFSDDIGDSISEKNPYFCELSSVYWIWKNITDEVIGIVHYRRFFLDNHFWYKTKKYLPVKLTIFLELHFISRYNDYISINNGILSEKKAKKILQEYDVILSKKRVLENKTVIEHYAEAHYEKDILIVRQIVENKCPEYLPEMDRLLNGHTFYLCNMMITKKEIFDKYCEWLFSILFEANKRIDVSGYNQYQRRIFGYLGERLLTVFVLHNRLTVYETPLKVLNMNNTDRQF